MFQTRRQSSEFFKMKGECITRLRPKVQLPTERKSVTMCLGRKRKNTKVLGDPEE